MARILRIVGIVLLVNAGVLTAGLAYQALTFEKEVDVATFAPPSTPNWYLVCPPDVCAAVSHQTAKVYDISLVELRDRFNAIALQEPRTELVMANADDLTRLYLQRSERVNYPDYITVRFIAVGEKQSTLTVLSRSKYGIRDRGVNRQRVERWLRVLGN